MVVEGFSEHELTHLLQPSIILIHTLQLLIEFQQLPDDHLQGNSIIEVLSDDIPHQIPRIRYFRHYSYINQMHTYRLPQRKALPNLDHVFTMDIALRKTLRLHLVMLLLRKDYYVDLVEGYIDLVEISWQGLELVEEVFVHLRVFEYFFEGLEFGVGLGVLGLVLHVKIL